MISTSAMTQRSLESLARGFVQFAEQECGAEPVYDALCRHAAADPDTLRLLWHAPVEQQRPNLLLAAVHHLILGGALHALRDYFPSAGGTRAIDAELGTCFVAFREAYRQQLIDRIAARTTQTNEIGRCAVLWPALHHIAALRGGKPLALLDFGCSAGLNLGVDAYRYAYDGAADASAEAPVIACRVIGSLPALDTPPRIALRQGIDVSPVELHDEDTVLWLRACLWPHDLERAQRFDLAVAVARKHGWLVQRQTDCIAALEDWVPSVPPDVVPVVFNSWVLTYLDRDERARCLRTIEALVQEAGALWLSAEAPALGLYPCEAPAPSVEGGEYAAGTLWTLCRAGRDRPRYDVIARSHPHGKWLEWLGCAASKGGKSSCA
jgi:hypothetical protein